MEKLRGAAVFGQSGGPTSVINASAAGVFITALGEDCITKVYGAGHGIRGMLEEDLYDISKEDPEELELMKTTPSSALGSVRYKMADPDVDDTDYKRLLEVFKKYDIRYFFYNGGNDSMDTCNKISKFMQKSGYECRCMGVPKTIDNDLYGTDHCPGYGSAAKYINTSIMEVYQDARVYDTGMVCIIEIMGRNAGWLTASSILAAERGMGPDLIYLPERDFSKEQFMADVKRVYDSNGHKVLVAASEGIHYSDGTLVAASGTKDQFGHAQLGGAGATLAQWAKEAVGSKVRSIELSLLQRCAAHSASATDVAESYEAGKTAVEKAVEGLTDYCIGFEVTRKPEYKCEMKLIPLDEVANTEKKIPDEWINAEGNFVTHDMAEYVLPLVQGESRPPMENGLPKYAVLKKVKAEI
ncbi:MAG: 6-phosphofructokinase [Lachnospiraceae bacterium]|nr:6-phosphofructokinase [Lachnospiraceae bacterium]